jgi:two-component system, NtrC family, response regulator HydG
MTDSTMVLISTHSDLSQTVADLVADIPGLSLQIVSTTDQALLFVQREEAALVVVHMARAGDHEDALRFLQHVAAAQRSIATLVIGEQYQAQQALALLRAGAADYLARPLDLGRLAYLIEMLTLRARHTVPAAEAPAAIPVQTLGSKDLFFYMPAGGMARMMGQIQRVAPQETTILLGGETGTGKTRLARLIHELSLRRDQPFLVMNCGALSDNLIESELFGHVRGAFTGADRDRIGKLAEVGRGTLLLDEIDALPLNLQAKLLRAVEERVFEPVGSNRSLPLEARLIAASNRVLDEEVAAGRFRSDLYFRLNVVGFYLQPLRERPSDLIETLARHFVAEFSSRNTRGVEGIASAALQALRKYAWPGNIRELRNVIERAVALCSGTILQLDDLPETLDPRGFRSPDRNTAVSTTPSRGLSLARAKEEAEATRIVETLKQHNNNRQRAAAELGVSRMTLYKKLHRYGLMGVS